MTDITFKEYSYLLNRVAYWLISNNKKIKTRNVYKVNGKPVKYNVMIKKIKENQGKSYNKYGRRFTEYAIYDNKDYKDFPNYVTGHDNVKYYLNTYTDMYRRVKAYRTKYKKNPKKITVQGANNNNTTSNTTDKTLAKFEKLFGKVTDFDSALNKINGRGYAYYYNSIYNTDTTMNRIYNRQGVNCTDSSQLMYRIGLALGYTVQFVHVKCQGGDGHIRLRLKHKKNTNNEWIYRDPACTLSDNNSSTCNWCMNGTVIAYNPAWILSDVMS